MERKSKQIIPGVYETASGRYCAVVQWIDKDGRRKKREKMFDSLEEAIQGRIEMRDDPGGVRQHAITVADYLTSWYQTQGPRLSPSTRERYADALAQFASAYGNHHLQALTSAHIREWVAKQIGTSAPSTINGKLRIIKQMLDTAVDDHRVPHNPASRVRTLPEPPTSGRRANYLSGEQLGALVSGALRLAKAGALSPDLARMIVLTALTGLRTGELLGLKWEDWNGRVITIQRAAYRGELKSTKTRKLRRIPTPPLLVELLNAQRAWLEQVDHPGRHTGLMWPSNPGSAKAGAIRRDADKPNWVKSTNTMRSALDRVVEYRKLPDITMHSLRRTWENLTREAGVDMLTRRSIAGWTTGKAQEIYAHVGVAEQERAMGALLRISGLETLTHETPPETPAKTPGA